MYLSIIIPTKNRAKRLNSALLSIQNNISQNTSFEVIVIDNGSNDETKEICDLYKKTIPNLIYRYDPAPGLLTGRHLGVQISQGEILCFLDDDVEINRDYIRGIVNIFSSPNITLATGPCLPKFEIPPPDWLKYFWVEEKDLGRWCGSLSLLDFGNDPKEIDPSFIWGLNLVIRKNTLLELDGFNPDIAPKKYQDYQGDGETGLTLKAIKMGYTGLYHPNLQLHHNIDATRLNEDYFIKRAFTQGIFNSFTAIRKNHFEVSITIRNKTFRDKIHPYYNWIKFWIPKKDKKIPIEVEMLKNKIKESEIKGFQAHQKAFEINQKVKDWVLRPNYWDYKLPDGI
ncbi:glycosyltransferase involved in cell wall biosynthesis [Flavobacterium sp. W4I14]|nr:glycosyltransferase involved in cell wall biosynthesis [Flavobacterium sp. W4I14]